MIVYRLGDGETMNTTNRGVGKWASGFYAKGCLYVEQLPH